MKLYKWLIDTEKIPEHVAIIMDGNRRWAEKRSLPKLEGHKRGADVIESLMEITLNLGIKVVSLYAFSTENWLRSKSEVDGLWNIMASLFRAKKDKINENGIRVVFSGTEKRLPPSIKSAMRDIVEITKSNKRIILNFCINYGGRQDIVDSVNRWAEKRKGNEKITIKKLENNLYTSGLPDIDLMLRTGGEYRISNFLLWQLSYAEFIFMKVLWPDFKPYHLYKAIYQYQKRERRFGGS
ncbi:MAG: polyprenyl diphosphate synthase [Spirochaetota bacterium]|nr:polyprenyl diphosphate synthase [Spirochaetota bacterium]